MAAVTLGVTLAWALVAKPENHLLARLAAVSLAVEFLVRVVFVSAPVPRFGGTPSRSRRSRSSARQAS